MSYPAIGIAICTHASRGGRAQRLADAVDADMVGVDMGGLGAAANHRACWDWLAATDLEWGIVLEDDALPVPGFRAQARAAIASSPAGVLSFYMGRNRPPHWQDSYAQGIATGKHYLLAPELLHAVGYAIHRDLIDAVREATATTRHFNEAVSDWCRATGRKVAYTAPSLVDHDHTLPSLIANQPTRYDESAPGSVPRNFTPPGWERRAWTVGERADWDRSSVAVLPEPGKKIKGKATHRARCTVCQVGQIGPYAECEEWGDRHVDGKKGHAIVIHQIGTPA